LKDTTLSPFKRDGEERTTIEHASYWRKPATVMLALIMAAQIPAACSEAAKAKGTASPSPASVEYTIGTDDLLAVNVWREPEISRNVVVRPDGKISLPLVGDLRASGRTPVQLQDDIKEQLSNYLANPEVTVIVQEARSQKFNILGEVEHPGSYALSRSMTVLDAIAIAGGLRDFAKKSKIYVLRVTADGSRSRLQFNYKEVIQGQSLAQNVELQPRDTVVVP
jgi:polysaccharide biosynthesis/export protein